MIYPVREYFNMIYTYVIQSKKDNRFYTGSTNDLRKRFKQHNQGGISSTKVADHLPSFIMKLVLMTTMQELGKNILKQAWVKDI
jgi:predicted GIY-YIG superfamily endonuclease